MTKLLLILLSAVLHTACLPPWNVSFLAWVALVPFLHALRGLTIRRAGLAGLAWGTAAIWGIGYWVPAALGFYYQQPWWFGVIFALGASIVFAGAYSAGFAASLGWMGKATGGAERVLLTAALWVVWELARARLLTGDPWLLLGYALGPDARLRQAADLGGVYVLSFVVVFVNAAVAEMLSLTRISVPSLARLALPAAGLLGAAYAYGEHRLAMGLPRAPEVRLAVVQGNNDLGSQWQERFYGVGLEQYLRMSVEAARERQPDLIVWPESAVTFFLGRETVYQKLVVRMLKKTGADLIVGAPHFEDPDPARPIFFNSAFYVTADGAFAQRYDKVHLLPFAEYFPLRTIDFLRRRFERVRYFTPGDGGKLLATRAGKVAVVICFEGIFPDLVRRQMAGGADLLVNLSNDAWLGPGAGPEQHLQMVALRAVENRTWVVRATTTGISAIIDPYGNIVQRTAELEAAVIDATVVPMRVDTFYKRFGDVFAAACLLVVGAVAALARRGR